MMYGKHIDGRTCGPIPPDRVNESGWVWYETEADRVAGESLDDKTTKKTLSIGMACETHIGMGFYCDALGSSYLYPCKQDATHRDQTNLAGLVLESALPGTPADWTGRYWCSDANDVWELRTHTAAQIQAVGRAASAHIAAAVGRCDTLTRQVQAIAADSAQTEAERITAIQAITWDAP